MQGTVRRCAPVAIWVVLVALVVPGPAQAAFPGQNGRIAFTGTNQSTAAVDIYSAESSGAGLARLTDDGISDNAVFSPDGSRLAFTSGTAVYIGDQNANDRQLVLDIGVGAAELDWSPDGTQLVAAFPNCAEFDCEYDIYVFGTDGSGLTNLTSSIFSEQNPSWSPDGSKIAFDGDALGGAHDVYTINADGSDRQNITEDLANPATEPDWSPDGSKIAFEVSSVVFVSNPDGTGKVSSLAGRDPAWSPDGTRFAYTGFGPDPPGGPSIVDTTGPYTGFHGSLGFGRSADWQVRQPDPVPPASGTGFPRAKGATPVSVALVLNYNRCFPGPNANKQHGPPLAYPSCTPARTGNPVTLGTPETNGLPAEGEGYVRFDTVVGDPTTAADEADVRVRVHQTDLRSAFGNHADYTGALVLFAPLRTSDLWNAGGDPDGSGTMVDFPLRVAVPCTATPGPEGGTCSIDTTIDAVVPGFVRERKRMVLQLGQVLVHYAGGDNDPYTLENNRPLLAQGLFVP